MAILPWGDFSQSEMMFCYVHSKYATCRMRITDQSETAVSVSRRETWLAFRSLTKLFCKFFCLKMLRSSQMWLVCFLVVRTVCEMFNSRCCAVESHERTFENGKRKPRRCGLSFFQVTTETNSLITFCRLYFIFPARFVVMWCSSQVKISIKH